MEDRNNAPGIGTALPSMFYVYPKPSILVKDWITLFFAAAIAVLFRRTYGFAALLFTGYMPGLGTFMTVVLTMTAVFYRVGKNVHLNAGSVFITLCVFLLSVSVTVYADAVLSLISHGLLIFLIPMAALMLSGRTAAAYFDVAVIPETIKFGLKGLFNNFPRPFYLLANTFRSAGKKSITAIIGAIAAIPMVLLVLFLLSSADAVFAGIFSGFFEFLKSTDSFTIMKNLITVTILSLMAFSFIFSCSAPTDFHEKSTRSFNIPCSFFIPALTALDVSYIIFAAIQFTCLFGGAKTAAMVGGYAQYARSGFFQLVAVSIINVVTILLTVLLTGGKTGKFSKLLLTLMTVLTFVILLSSVWRMRLYISVFGLTLLRCMTLWGIAFIAVCLIGAGIKIFRPSFRFWPLFLLVGLTGYIAFTFTNIDARIAEYNVDAYLEGQTEYVDIIYLSGLSPDVLPALKKLQHADPGYVHRITVERAIELLELQCSEGKTLRSWTICYQRNGKP